jgi:NDP-sugar pyrophosphorylase family protein
VTTLVVLAAGLGTRFGGLKPLAPVGPSGEALLDYALYDARSAGFGRAVLVVRRETEELFRRHVAGAADCVIQEAPLGTAHAVLAARDAVTEPFGVCNADDFYGAEAYRLVRRHLDAGSPDYAVVAYPLAETLSPFGGVSRAIVEMDAGEYLARLTEVRNIVQAKDEIVSMNFWAFTPAVFAALERQFARFAGPGEFLLSSALNEQVAAGAARVRVLRTSERWFGVTFPGDQAAAGEAIARLVRAGAYPDDLFRVLPRVRFE